MSEPIPPPRKPGRTTWKKRQRLLTVVAGSVLSTPLIAFALLQVVFLGAVLVVVERRHSGVGYALAVGIVAVAFLVRPRLLRWCRNELLVGD